MCTPTKFAWIKNITLDIKALTGPYAEQHWYMITLAHLQAYIRVAEVCRKNPAIFVEYVFRGLGGSSLLSRGWHRVDPSTKAFFS